MGKIPGFGDKGNKKSGASKERRGGFLGRIRRKQAPQVTSDAQVPLDIAEQSSSKKDRGIIDRFLNRKRKEEHVTSDTEITLRYMFHQKRVSEIHSRQVYMQR